MKKTEIAKLLFRELANPKGSNDRKPLEKLKKALEE